MAWSLTNAFEKAFGRPLTADEVIQGAANSTRDAIKVEATSTSADAVALTSLVAQKAAMPLVISGSTVTRPSDTNVYASGDLVANSTTAGSVTPITFASAVLAAGGCVRVERARIFKSGTSTTNASFRLHLFSATPSTIANGDNAAFLTARTGYVGALDVTIDRAFSDGAHGAGVSLTGSPMTITIASGTTLYGLLEARGAYTPASAETINAVLETYRF